ncbi:MAG: hypothetical protein H7Y04_09820 [Verrucomicrobia bacterium]|nr:hypothetical protein [Cytophagales bacterium]
MMTTDEKNLWQKIENFQFNDLQVRLSFADRLARENGWSEIYTAKVMEEYKKFMFLCCITETGVTPSDPVDQAWHLHLTFTKSYWIDFCRNTLGKEIHHNPTKGGRGEAEKFNTFYTDTHKLYQEKFGVEPPANIWHDNQTRFTDIDFQGVNLKKFWLIKKTIYTFDKVAFLGILLLSGLFFIQASGNPLVIFGILAVFIGVIIILIKYDSKINENKNNSDSGVASGCGSSDDHHGNDRHGSSDSGCSGCSSSGCSGCGGGGG